MMKSKKTRLPVLSQWSKHKKFLVGGALLLLLTVLLLAGFFFFSKEKEEAMSINGISISPQLYRAYLIQKTIAAASQLPDGEADITKQQIEEVPATEWILTQVREQILADTIVKAECDRQQIPVAESDRERLATYLGEEWDTHQAVYEANNCDRASFEAASQSFLYTDLLKEQYVKDNPVPEAESVSPSSVTVQYFLMNQYGMEGNLFTKEQREELIRLAKNYIKQIRKGKSIDEMYRDYQSRIGEEIGQVRALSPTILSFDNVEYTAKIPNFVETLKEAEVGKAFYAEDDYYLTVGIRLKDTEQKVIQNAYQESAKQKVGKEAFWKYLSALIEDADVWENTRWIKQNPPESITLTPMKNTTQGENEP